MDQVMALLRSDKTRKFSIDIETDTTIAPDEQKEQATVVEFLGAATNFIGAAGQAAQQSPQMVPLFLEMFKSAARRFKMGRELEDVIDDAVGNVLRALGQTQANQQPDPEAEKARLEIERDNAKCQAEQQRLNAKLQAEIQRLAQKMQAEIQLKAQEALGNVDVKAFEAQSKAELDAAVANREQTRESIIAGLV